MVFTNFNSFYLLIKSQNLRFFLYINDIIKIVKDGDESILDNMAFITEHLAEFDLTKVMQSLGLNNVFGSSTKK